MAEEIAKAEVKSEAAEVKSEAAKVEVAANAAGDKKAADKAADVKDAAGVVLEKVKAGELTGASESTMHAVLAEVQALRKELREGSTRGFWDSLFRF